MGKKNKKRKSRDKIDKEEINLMKPLNLANFSLENDPCFGKLHDLKAPECARCGDAEICAIIFSQSVHIQRAEVAAETPLKTFHDEPAKVDFKAVRKLIRSKLKKSVSHESIITHVQKDYKLSTKKIMRMIIKQVNKQQK